MEAQGWPPRDSDVRVWLRAAILSWEMQFPCRLGSRSFSRLICGRTQFETFLSDLEGVTLKESLGVASGTEVRAATEGSCLILSSWGRTRQVMKPGAQEPVKPCFCHQVAVPSDESHTRAAQFQLP